MAFFLIGRGPEDDLRSLSDRLFATRQDAMAELSRLSSDPSFDQWDAEVFVMDLDAGVPVLLVRPQGTEPVAESVSPEPAATEEAAAQAWEADLPVVIADQTGAEETVAEEVAELPAKAEPAEVPEAAEETPELAADATEETVAPVEAEAETEETPAPVETESETDDLREALLRTTEHMTAEGVIPLESVGLGANVEAEPSAQTEEATAFAADVEVPDAVELAEEPEIPEGLEDTEEVETAQPTSEEGAETQADTVSEWPWNAPAEPRQEEEGAVSPDIATVYEALEEPHEAIEEPAAAEPEASTEALVEPVTEARESMSSAAEGADEDSDFILDLDAIEPVALEADEAAGAEEAPSPAAEPTSAADEAEDEVAVEAAYSSPLTDYTCEDCVYVETCPNRDQRAPKDCGSFQWK